MLAEKKDCTGCAACYNSCAQKAILIKEDEYGFLYPEINNANCIKCGSCTISCPIQTPVLGYKPKCVFAATNKNKTIQTNSSSAGVFASIAEKMLEQGSIVYGCSWDNSFRVFHRAVKNKEELQSILKSKYIQSRIGDCFHSIKNNLEDGATVLFSGTSCQVAGLRAFLRKEYKNLFTVEIICHGVPSNKFFDSYIEFLEKKNHYTVLKYDFRFKNERVGSYLTKISALKGGKIVEIILPWQGTSFGYLYMNSLINRQCCYSCSYIGDNRYGDITLGDYWNVSKFHKSINGKLGASLVIVNTNKGQNIFDLVKNNLLVVESTMEMANKSNPTLTTAVCEPADRNQILETWLNQGYKSVENYYYEQDSQRRKYIFALRIRQYLPKVLYESLVKIIKH